MGSNLSEINLTEAVLQGSDLSGSNLYRARLSKTVWIDGKTCAESSRGKCN